MRQNRRFRNMLLRPSYISWMVDENNVNREDCFSGFRQVAQLEEKCFFFFFLLTFEGSEFRGVRVPEGRWCDENAWRAQNDENNPDGTRPCRRAAHLSTPNDTTMAHGVIFILHISAEPQRVLSITLTLFRLPFCPFFLRFYLAALFLSLARLSLRTFSSNLSTNYITLLHLHLFYNIHQAFIYFSWNNLSRRIHRARLWTKSYGYSCRLSICVCN